MRKSFSCRLHIEITHLQDLGWEERNKTRVETTNTQTGTTCARRVLAAPGVLAPRRQAGAGAPDPGRRLGAAPGGGTSAFPAVALSSLPRRRVGALAQAVAASHCGRSGQSPGLDRAGSGASGRARRGGRALHSTAHGAARRGGRGDGPRRVSRAGPRHPLARRVEPSRGRARRPKLPRLRAGRQQCNAADLSRPGRACRMPGGGGVPVGHPRAAGCGGFA